MQQLRSTGLGWCSNRIQHTKHRIPSSSNRNRNRDGDRDRNRIRIGIVVHVQIQIMIRGNILFVAPTRHHACKLFAPSRRRLGALTRGCAVHTPCDLPLFLVTPARRLATCAEAGGSRRKRCDACGGKEGRQAERKRERTSHTLAHSGSAASVRQCQIKDQHNY